MAERKFEYFLSVAETRSITKAAKKNYISQPSMTQYINRLEASVGEKLFDRETTPMTLTRAGEVYLDYVRKWLDLENELEMKLNELRASVSGTIRVGIPLQMQGILVHKILPPFLRQYPNIDVVLSDDASPVLEKSVLNGLADCALIYAIAQEYDKLNYDFLESERVRVICSRNHPLAAGKASTPEEPVPVSLDQLQDQIFCLMDKVFVVRKLSDQFFLKYKFVPKSKITMSSMNAILYTVCSDAVLSFIPDYVIEAHTGEKELAYLEIEKEKFAMNLSLVYPARKSLSPANLAFIEFVKKFYSSEKTNQ